ncbi:MAG: Mur ligase domain-containing protein [Candidatus Paceibacterota bacterium]|jgi:UDP-N-acetylmuramate: L-alanyl-gamma-D-glutamyl-meso-diaminopimelate ligase
MQDTSTPPKSATPKKVHFIGICGVAMSAVATALWQKGYRVTGSDSGFFPPVSTHLTNLGIPYYPGFHPEKMVEGGVPDFVVVGNAIATKNPEVVYAQENGIPLKSFPEVVGEYLIQRHSVVATGTWGKTTSSALLAHILAHANLKPSYLIGGVTQDGSPSAVIDQGDWSVAEGDEYTTAKWDQRPKFMHYKPTHLLLTAVRWDHADVYPREEDYFNAFRKLIDLVPKGETPMDGLIVGCSDNAKLIELLAETNREYVSYGSGESANYRYHDIAESKGGIRFSIDYHGKEYQIESPLLGAYNAENVTGCFAMAKEIGIAPGEITDAIKGFHGMKRRLEKRYEHKVTVIDDIAHSAEKVKSVLLTLRKAYNGSIIAVYEPNSGNRTPQSKPAYSDAFKDATTVVIPRLSKLKVDESNPEKMFEGQELADTIAQTHSDTHYFESDEELVTFVTENRKEGDVIAFLGSHGFRGMIEAAIKKIAL